MAIRTATASVDRREDRGLTHTSGAAGGGTPKIWNGTGADKTPQEIAEDVADRLTQISEDTNEVHAADTMLLPIAKLRHIANTPMSLTVPGITILDWTMNAERKFGLSMVDSLPELKETGTGDTNQGLLYQNDPMVLEYMITMDLETLPPVRKNLQF